jgi:pimeloyl-ACP methyl ester carboxylesterase
MKPSTEGTRYTLAYGQYRLAYEVYGSGDRVLVRLHGLLLDANLSRGLARRLAAQGNRVVLLDSFIAAAASDPHEIAAVLHGVFPGPIAPTSDQRRSISAPALVLGHGIDLIHSFTDAKRLARQLPQARLIRTRTFAELWVWPARLTGEISEFLDRVWAGDEPLGHRIT